LPVSLFISPEFKLRLAHNRIAIVFCAHPRLAKKIKNFPEDLDGQPMILPAILRQIAHTLKEFLYENNIEPKIVG
jgi:hypothetical protein